MTSMRDYGEQDWRGELDRIKRADRHADWAFVAGMLWVAFCIWLVFSV